MFPLLVGEKWSLSVNTQNRMVAMQIKWIFLLFFVANEPLLSHRKTKWAATKQKMKIITLNPQRHHTSSVWRSMKPHQLISMKLMKGSNGRRRTTQKQLAVETSNILEDIFWTLRSHSLFKTLSLSSRQEQGQLLWRSICNNGWMVHPWVGLGLQSGRGLLGYQGVGVHYSLTWIACALNCLDLRLVHSE